MRLEDATLGWLFATLSRMHHSCMHQLFRARGLEEISHPRLIFLIEQAERRGQALSQRQLAEGLAISPASVAVSLRRMEKGGLLERQTDEQDSRRNTIVLTPKGRKLIQNCKGAARELEQQLFLGFDEQEQQTLRGYFLRIAANMQSCGATLPADAPPNPPPLECRP